MAGLGRKLFTRERLTSADLNGYLMDQTVMAFDTALARDAAIPTPTEGMVVYLRDVNRFFWRSDSAWLYFGGSAVGLSTSVPPIGTNFVAATGRNPAAWLDGSGFVQLVGAVSNTPTFTPPSTALFTLAAGFRPPVLMNFACASSIGTYNLEIAATGVARVMAPVAAQAAGVVWAVDGVRYPAA